MVKTSFGGKLVHLELGLGYMELEKVLSVWYGQSYCVGGVVKGGRAASKVY